MRPEATTARTALDRIGGPWALSWQVGVLAYGPAILAAVFDATRHGGSPSAWIACAVAANTALFALLVPVRRWLLPGAPRYRRPRPVATIGVFLTAGALRGTAMATFAVALGLQDTYEWGFRQAAGASLSTVVLIATTLAVDAVASYRSERRRLLEEEARVAALEHAAATHRDEVARAVRERLIDGLRAAFYADPSAAALDAAIDTHVHPLVDELRRGVDLQAPMDAERPTLRIGWRELAASSLSTSPFHPIAVGIGLAGVMTAFVVYRFGMAYGLVITAAICLANAVPLAVARSIARSEINSRPRRIGLIAVTHVVMLALTAGVVTATLRRSAVDLPPAAAAAAIALIALTAFLINASGAAASAAVALTAITARDVRAATETREWRVARAEEVARSTRTALAAAVHGPVQSALIRAAVRLDDSTPTPEAMAHLERDIEHALASSTTEARTRVPLRTAFDGLAAVWTGAATIEIRATSSDLARLQVDPIGASTILEIVREGISNAVRHAGADRVDVQVTLDDSCAVVSVTSNATRSAARSRRGLGTDMLDRVCLSWTRSANATGTRLVARVPVDVTR